MLQRSIFSAIILGLALIGPAHAAAPGVTLYGTDNQPLGSASSPLSANATGYSTVTPFTIGGSPVAAGRATAANCSVAGNVTYTMASGGTYTVPVIVGWMSFPFAVTGAPASTATCTYANLN